MLPDFFVNDQYIADSLTQSILLHNDDIIGDDVTGSIGNDCGVTQSDTTHDNIMLNSKGL